MIARSLAVASLAAVAYAWLGVAVERRPPQPVWAFDAAGESIAGFGTHVALVFTASCWWYVLLALGVCAIMLAIARPEWQARTMFAVVTTVVAWQTSDALKNVFARPRPAHWYLHHEMTYAYSSGHAMFATVVYFLWSYFFFTSSLPPLARRTIAAGFALWGCGVIWSRLALGAHWPTDLIGGVLLGIVMLALASAVAFAWPARART